MKHNQHITFNGPRTTLIDVCHWAQELARLHARLAPRFARPEPHRRVLAYLQGILSDISRKNSWQLAEHAREARHGSGRIQQPGALRAGVSAPRRTSLCSRLAKRAPGPPFATSTIAPTSTMWA